MLTSELLLPLTWRVPSLAEPCAVHRDLWTIGEETASWARSRGLVVGDADTSRLGRGRFERLACRVFPDVPAERAALFSRWLLWLFAFDDLRDETPFGCSATEVDALYEEMARAVRRGTPRAGAGPLEIALAELWRESSREMGGDWRRRFRIHLGWHRQGCADEAVGRRTRTPPCLADYPRLRRRTNGPFMLDLAEPVLGVEIPDAVVRTRSWQRLFDGVNDVTAWCNDVASYPHESGLGNSFNYVALAVRELELEPLAAIAWVGERIEGGLARMAEAAERLVEEAAWRELAEEDRERAGRVVRALLSVPRAQLDWLVESGRYSPMPDTSAPSPRRRVGVALR
ncbi:terpene synthase family protein [Actinocorallia populi]|uniref:terpene synthase family protein n=1 Tax=Actinocorallia populi TaxID=2079200 RepID=UPI000D095F37|nr:terpene synthase family protein [Actinocorallia populi]